VSRGQSISFSFPPFAGWVRRIILTCTGIYLFQAVMRIFAPIVVDLMQEWLALIPVAVMHGRVWQLVTYSLLHVNFISWGRIRRSERWARQAESLDC